MSRFGVFFCHLSAHSIAAKANEQPSLSALCIICQYRFSAFDKATFRPELM